MKQRQSPKTGPRARLPAGISSPAPLSLKETACICLIRSKLSCVSSILYSRQGTARRTAMFATYLSLSELPAHNLLQHSSQSISSTDFHVSRSRHRCRDAGPQRHILTDRELTPPGEQGSLASAQHREYIGCRQHMLRRTTQSLRTQRIERKISPWLSLCISISDCDSPNFWQ
jgi:hypothetical protein